MPVWYTVVMDEGRRDEMELDEEVEGVEVEEGRKLPAPPMEVLMYFWGRLGVRREEVLLVSDL